MSPTVILYHYTYSPYAQKISLYLALRRTIPYLQVLQPPVLPRPDLLTLNITYRRIPVLAIGNTIFFDTDNILSALETCFPSSLSHHSAEQWSAFSDNLFPYCGGLLPADLPIMKDPKFLRDRREYKPEFGKVTPEVRGKCLEVVREAFAKVEGVLEESKNDWIAGGEVTLADVNAVWCLNWPMSVPGALDGSDITPEKFPRTFAWVRRFLELAKEGVREEKVSGEEARGLVSKGEKVEVDIGQETGEWGRGEVLEVVPTDTGTNHPQKGRLVKVGDKRIVLRVDVEGSTDGIMVIFPRRRYEVRRVGNTGVRL